MQSFEIGDVVTLKSGGSEMSVVKIQLNEITCTWIDSLGFLQKEIFNALLLMKVPPEYSAANDFL